MGTQIRSSHVAIPEFLRVEEINFRLSPPYQALQHLPSSVCIFLHLGRSAREVIVVQGVCDIGQVSAAEVVGEADEGIELILVYLKSISIRTLIKGLGQEARNIRRQLRLC